MSTTPNTGGLAICNPCWDTRNGAGLNKPLNVPWPHVRHLAINQAITLPAPANRSLAARVRYRWWTITTFPASPVTSLHKTVTLAYKVFKRPLAVFFLPAPPNEIPPTREFRTLPDADLQALHADTYDVQVRKAHAFQLTLREIFAKRNPSEPQILRDAPLDMQRPIPEQATAVRHALGISLEDQVAWKSDEVALKRWRESIEAMGVFVFKAPFKQKDISGFCLPDADFPLIYLNNSTTKTWQIFSLLHELAHLLFNVADISKFDASYVNRLPAPERRIEQFCNKVAAEILIPSGDFARQIVGLPRNAELAEDYLFANLASRYGVSREW